MALSAGPFAPCGIITLTTDFGTKDPFVGVMKGVVLARFAGARIIDLTHELAPQSVAEAAFWTERVSAWFPAGSVHVAVVDPGVGTSRAILCVESRGQLFLAPDNGLLGGVLDADADARVTVVDASWSAGASATFHGRDVFAPIAADLASGARGVASFGAAGVPRARSALERAVVRGAEVEGVVATVDRFGNLLTNIRAAHLAAVPAARRVAIAGCELPIVRTYGDAAAGELVALVGSFDALELACVNGSAATVLRAGRGERVSVK